jgi:hypothetical protein
MPKRTCKKEATAGPNKARRIDTKDARNIAQNGKNGERQELGEAAGTGQN